MSKHSWILWAVILMIAGTAGLGYYFAQKRTLQEQTAQAAAAAEENSATDEYLKMYEDWIRLSPEDKVQNPWGQDPYGGPEIQKQLQKGQADRLRSDLENLEKGIIHFPDELAQILYGPGWQQTVEEYRRRQSKADVILIGTIFLLAGSGLLLIGGLGKIMFMYSLSRLKNNSRRQPEQNKEYPDKEASVDDFPQTPAPEREDIDLITQTQPISDAEKVIASSRSGKQKNKTSKDKDKPGYFEKSKKTASPLNSPAATSKDSLSELSPSLSAAVSDKPARDSYFGWAVRDEESADLETLMTTEPLTKELTELTEEVSAIRQFAAQQQDQVRKLQDGYDWIIIRRFCMRIIRSIDNIEDRIGRLDDPDCETAQCLEDIHDELVFALESSGIEQFKPDLEMPYKGLEKYAEAVRQRVQTEDETLCGCIAEIVRPGYQYLISDDDVKIVRCAQVKLYDTSK